MIAWVFGGGLLGRGFLGPLLANRFEIHLIDVKQPPREVRVHYPDVGADLVYPVFPYQLPRLPSQEPDVVYTAVGNANLLIVGGVLRKRFGDAFLPVLTCENDRLAALRLGHMLGLNAYSCVASVTIPDPGDDTLIGDSQGTFYYPLMFEVQHPRLVPDSTPFVRVRSYTSRQQVWDMKYYFHLAPHALCAYLGLAEGLEFIAEVMAKLPIDIAVRPLLRAYGERWPSPDPRREWEREARRFTTLPDRVARVARNPAEKVLPGERLYIGYTAALRWGDAQAVALWRRAYARALELAGFDLNEVHWLPEWTPS